MALPTTPYHTHTRTLCHAISGAHVRTYVRRFSASWVDEAGDGAEEWRRDGGDDDNG